MTYASEVLADSPYAYWKCDDGSGSTLADSSGNAQTISIIGSGLTFGVTQLASGLGNAVTFNGNQFLDRTMSLDFNSIPVTVECIVSLSDITTNKRALHAFGSEALMWRLGDTGDSNGSINTVFGAGGIGQAHTGSVMSINTPYHFVGTFDNAGNADVWLNGTKVLTHNPTNTNLSPGTAFDFGVNSNKIIGTVQHIAIYRGVVLSDYRIQYHAYIAGLGSAPAAPTRSRPSSRLKRPLNRAATARAVR